MQWNTFRSPKIVGLKATVWASDSKYRGVCGTIIGTQKDAGLVTIRFANGAVTDEPFAGVAIGDNHTRVIASVK